VILGVDIGGTNIKFGVVNEQYELLETCLVSTEAEKGAEQMVSKIIETAKALQEKYSIEKIGIGTPGTVDYKTGVCVRAANLPYQNTPVAEMVEKALNLPVRLANDATCAVLGELYAGWGRKYRNLIMITLGTGVGGGIIIEGKPYYGANGGAGEFGHLIIEKEGIECRCGQKGCYEKYASVTALIRQTEEAVIKYPESLLAKRARDGVSGRTAFDAMREGCDVAVQVVDDYIEYIATGVKSLIRVFQPEAVVFGGAITNEQDYLLLPLKEKVHSSAELCISKLKNDAGVIGAAATVKEN